MAEYNNLFIVSTTASTASKKGFASKQFGSSLPVKLEALEEKVTGLFDTIEAIENILDSL